MTITMPLVKLKTKVFEKPQVVHLIEGFRVSTTYRDLLEFSIIDAPIIYTFALSYKNTFFSTLLQWRVSLEFSFVYVLFSVDWIGSHCGILYSSLNLITQKESIVQILSIYGLGHWRILNLVIFPYGHMFWILYKLILFAHFRALTSFELFSLSLISDF